MWLASPRSGRRDGPVPLDLPSRCSGAKEVHLNNKPRPNCGATISQAGSEFKSKVEGKLQGAGPTVIITTSTRPGLFVKFERG